MLALNVHLPENLHRAAREVAAHEGVSLDQLIVRILGEKIAAVQTEAASPEDTFTEDAAWERMWTLITDATPQPLTPLSITTA